MKSMDEIGLNSDNQIDISKKKKKSSALFEELWKAAEQTSLNDSSKGHRFCFESPYRVINHQLSWLCCIVLSA